MRIEGAYTLWVAHVTDARALPQNRRVDNNTAMLVLSLAAVWT